MLLLFSRSVWSNSFVTPWNVAHQASLSMEFPRQEYWTGLPFPSPRDPPNPGTELAVSCIGRRTIYHWAISSWFTVNFVPWAAIQSSSPLQSCKDVYNTNVSHYIYLLPSAWFNSSLPVQVNLNLDSFIHSPSAGSGAEESGVNRPSALWGVGNAQPSSLTLLHTCPWLPHKAAEVMCMKKLYSELGYYLQEYHLCKLWVKLSTRSRPKTAL